MIKNYKDFLNETKKNENLTYYVVIGEICIKHEDESSKSMNPVQLKNRLLRDLKDNDITKLYTAIKKCKPVYSFEQDDDGRVSYWELILSGDKNIIELINSLEDDNNGVCSILGEPSQKTIDKIEKT
jgi:hypothetical protein